MSLSTISPELAQNIQAYQQTVSKEPDGPGKRVGKVGEFTLIAPVKPGGAEMFRQNLQTHQARAGYYEHAVGTVHDLRIGLFDNDTRLLFAATFDGDLKPYVADVVREAALWLDDMFLDTIEGYPGANDPHLIDFLTRYQLEADIWFAANPDLTAKDAAKAQKLMKAFEILLDTASS